MFIILAFFDKAKMKRWLRINSRKEFEKKVNLVITKVMNPREFVLKKTPNYFCQ